MGITPDDNLARRPQTRFDDDVMDTAAAAVEHVLDAVLCSEPAHRRQSLRGGLGRGSEVVVEHEGNTVRMGDAAVLHLVLKHLDHEAGAEVVHDHPIDIGHHHIAGADFAAAAGLG